ncbi:asparagine synthetase B [Colwellia sp. D2M02]|nr:asparagine synthetase B [Colwellia sp. D2M02]
MCGFVVSITKTKCINTPDRCIGQDILLRGEDSVTSTITSVGGFYIKIEFAHLFITTPSVVQPIQNLKKTLVINGEIYNYHEMAELLGLDASLTNDSDVFFQYINKFGLKKALTVANGMFSGVLINNETGQFDLFTDHLGKKPLIIWNSLYGWHIGTGIDSNLFKEETNNLRVLSPGSYEFHCENGNLTSKFRYKNENSLDAHASLSKLLESSISLRTNTKKPFAIALSGGLDSSIIAAIVETKLHLKPQYYVVGSSFPDKVIELAKHLNIPNNRLVLVPPPTQSNFKELLFQTCKITKSFNPSIVSNGLSTLLLCQAIKNDGFRILLSGEGADEFFCGYQGMYNGSNNPEKMRSSLVKNLYFTELRRLDLISASCSVEVRCPFLDKRVTQFALCLNAKDLCCVTESTGKIKLRNEFTGLLPDSIVHAPKEPFDITAGIQKLVIDELSNISSSERDALEIVFSEVFGDTPLKYHPYFSHYPAFDKMIDNRKRKYELTYN